MIELQDQEARMPYVRFERVAVENKAESLKQGHYVAIDVDFACVTPPYSKDVMKFKVQNWFDQLEKDAAKNRFPHSWIGQFKKAYEAWKNGQELPLNGVPIRGWGIISPAQQETLIKLNILTVEQLAAVTEEGTRRIGMGAIDLKNKAQAWLKTLNKSGKAALEIAELRAENDKLSIETRDLREKLEEMTKQIKSFTKLKAVKDEEITVDDIT